VTSARTLAGASLTTPNLSGCETSRARKRNKTRRANRAPARRPRSFAPNFTPRHERTSAALGLGTDIEPQGQLDYPRFSDSLPTQSDTGIGSSVVGVDDDAIRTLLTRLARAHPSGGTVVERAAVLAAGADSEAVMTWILAHGGKPEAAMETSTRHGLHGSHLHASGSGAPIPSRFVLPAGALD
jgi:hypothetical protein